MTSPTARAALRSYRTGTTLEFAALLDLPEAQAEAQLERAGAVRRGALWVTH
jgi:hypothetical protein